MGLGLLVVVLSHLAGRHRQHDRLTRASLQSAGFERRARTFSLLAQVAYNNKYDATPSNHRGNISSVPDDYVESLAARDVSAMLWPEDETATVLMEMATDMYSTGGPPGWDTTSSGPTQLSWTFQYGTSGLAASGLAVSHNDAGLGSRSYSKSETTFLAEFFMKEVGYAPQWVPKPYYLGYSQVGKEADSKAAIHARLKHALRFMRKMVYGRDRWAHVTVRVVGLDGVPLPGFLGRDLRDGTPSPEDGVAKIRVQKMWGEYKDE
jgi:hypothetical protein